MMDMTLDDYGCSQPYSRGLAFLRQDVGHMKRIREFETREAKWEALLKRAAQVMVNGNKNERRTIAKQIDELLDQRGDAA